MCKNLVRARTCEGQVLLLFSVNKIFFNNNKNLVIIKIHSKSYLNYLKN